MKGHQREETVMVKDVLKLPRHRRAAVRKSCLQLGLAALYLLIGFLNTACGEDPFTAPPALAIPDTLRVPPVEHKQTALQAVLDGVINSLTIDPEFCTIQDTDTRAKTVVCEHPNEGGRVEFIGDLFEQERELFVFGDKVRSVRYELSLKYIKLENYAYQASIGRQRIAPPNGCTFPVIINGEGSLYTLKEDLLTQGNKRIPLNSGGVYQGTFSVAHDEREYEFEFTNHGFYYRRDITPIIITPENDESPQMRRAPIEALQVSLVYSGGFDLNDQLYSYQDVYIEVLTSQHWNEECQNTNRPMNEGPQDRPDAPPTESPERSPDESGNRPPPRRP